MKNILLILGVILSIPSNAQAKISPDNLRKDIDFLIGKYRENTSKFVCIH